LGLAAALELEAPLAFRALAPLSLAVVVMGFATGDSTPSPRATAATNGPPSVTGFAGGRPKVEEIVAYWPALIDKRVVQTKVEVLS